MNIKEIYKNLNSRKVSQNEFNRLNKNIKENYSIIEDISFYNPNLNLFSNYFINELSFNNDNKLYKIIKKNIESPL